MPIISPNKVGQSTSAARAPVAPSLAFLKPSYAATNMLNPQTGFIGPVIRALVWYGTRCFSLTERLLDQSTRLGRVLINVLGPFSVPVQTSRTIALDSVFEIISHSASDVIQEEFLDWAKHHAIQFYRAYENRFADGNVAVVFLPDNRPAGDLLKWDP